MEKVLLRENSLLSQLNKKPKQITEGVSNTSSATVFEGVPIWRLDVENLNGRIYTTELAAQIVSQNAITNVLRNHLEEFEAEISDIKAIAKNPKIENGMLKVDLEMVDDGFSSLVERIVSAGGRVGLSSVGYGTLDKDKKIQDYQLVRYADFVINPSALVFIEQESEVPQKEAVETIETSEAETTVADDEIAISEDVVETITDEEFLDIKERFNKWKK